MKKLSLNRKENKIISITLAAWGIIMIATGLLMAPKEPIIKTSYKVSINEGQVMQFKTNEIKLKDIELEILSYEELIEVLQKLQLEKEKAQHKNITMHI